jgi:hypothetical protein
MIKKMPAVTTEVKLTLMPFWLKLKTATKHIRTNVRLLGFDNFT